MFCRGADRYHDMQKAQEAVTLYKEFCESAVFVSTGQYMDYPGDDTYNGHYHYDGRADVYYHIGQAFGRAMLQTLTRRESDS